MPGFGNRISVSNNGVKTLLPGAPGSQGSVISDFFIYEAAQVIEIVNNETSDRNDKNGASATSNTGRAKIRFVKTGKQGLSDEWADPLIPHQTMYPLVGEYVLVFKMLGTYWYVGPLNTKRQITENAHPIASTPKSVKENVKDQLARQRGVVIRPQQLESRPGVNFKVRNVNPLKPFEGDIIYQGRYGQSIRFGSSQMVASSGGEQYPNIILRAGQGPNTAKTTEDAGPSALTNESINTDDSSIYLTSNQVLALVPATYGTNIHLRSLTDNKPVSFDGASILLNSDRIILNSKATSIFIFAKKGIHLNSLDDGFTLDTAGIIGLRTTNATNIYAEKTISIESKEDTTISTKRDINVSGDRNVTVYGNEIFLGGRSSKASPIAMAKPLKLFMFELLRTLMSTQPLTIGPTGVINPALVARLLVVYAKYQVLPDPFNPLWASNDNFVMKTNERTMASDLPANDSLKRVSGIGTVGPNEAITFTRDQATNAGLKDLRKLYDEELTSKL